MASAVTSRRKARPGQSFMGWTSTEASGSSSAEPTESDDDDDEDYQERSGRAAAQPRASQRTRARMTKAAGSTKQANLAGRVNMAASIEAWRSNSKRERARTRSTQNKHTSTDSADTDSQHFRDNAKPSAKKRRLSGRKKDKVKSYMEGCKKEEELPIPWHKLPYQILVQIFSHASKLVPDPLDRRQDTRWLLNAARICRAVSEPALTVLYQSPPLMTAGSAQRLLPSLQRDPALTRCNYRNKIQRLDIHVIPVLGVSRLGDGTFNVAELIALTPNLRHLWLLDTPRTWAQRWRIRRGRWLYQPKLFETLERTQIRLRSWRWENRFAPEVNTAAFIKTAHLLPPFQTLEHVTLSEFDDPFHLSSDSDSEASSPDPDFAPVSVEFAHAISLLTRLRSLHFVRCGIVNDALLQRLPRDLTTLSVIDCPSLVLDELQSYLQSHGRSLRSLTLRSDGSMERAFLSGLAEWCPELQVISIDCRYNSSRTSWVYAGDNRDQSTSGSGLRAAVRANDTAPNWPTTLQSMEFLNFRIDTVHSAEMFFRSLVLAAPNLPQLRQLVLKLIVDSQWRSRARFREVWMPRMERIFKRHAAPPSPTLTSMKSWQAHQPGLLLPSGNPPHVEGDEGDAGATATAGLRRSARLSKASTRSLHGRHLRNESNSHLYDDHGEGPSRRPSGPQPLHSKTSILEPASDVLDILGTLGTSPSTSKPRRKSEVERLAEAAGSDRPDFLSEFFGTFDEDGPFMAPEAHNNRFAGTGDEPRDKGKGKAVVRKKDITKEPPPVKVKVEESDEELFIHGMCDVVEVRVDNLRPTDQQFTEADFMDSELSGDASWDGLDPDPFGDETYAW